MLMIICFIKITILGTAIWQCQKVCTEYAAIGIKFVGFQSQLRRSVHANTSALNYEFSFELSMFCLVDKPAKFLLIQACPCFLEPLRKVFQQTKSLGRFFCTRYNLPSANIIK